MIIKTVQLPFESKQAAKEFDLFIAKSGLIKGRWVLNLIEQAMANIKDRSVQGQQLAQYMKEAQG